MLYQTGHPSWDAFGVSISSGVEIAVAASIPGTRSIVNKVFQGLFSSTVGTYGTPGSLVEGDQRRRSQSCSEVALSMFTRKREREREGDQGDDDSMKAIAREW